MSNIEKVLEAVNIVELIRENVDLKKAGNNYKGLCPFHSENTPSFVVSPEKKIFKCFGCGVAGNAINFHMAIKKLNFADALGELAEKIGLTIAAGRGKSTKKTKSQRDKLAILEDCALFFSQNLFDKKGQYGIKYLNEIRGLDVNFIEKEQLGYAPGGKELYKHLIQKGHSKKLMVNLGLIQGNDNKGWFDVFRNRVMFPIRDVEGHVIGFGGRSLSNDIMPKYLNSPESDVFIKGKSLYGLIDNGSEIKAKGYAILMEGYLDVLTAHSHGFSNSVASLGTSFTKDQAKTLSKYTKNVLICFDKDPAGIMAAEKTIFSLNRYGFVSKIVDTGEYKDPDELLNSGDVEQFREKIKNSLEAFDFLYLKYSSNLDLSSIEGKKSIVSSFSNFFKSLNSELDHEIYLSKLSSELKIGKGSIKSYLKLSKPLSKVEKEDNFKVDLNPLEIETLLFLLKYPDYIEELKGYFVGSGNSQFKESITTISMLQSDKDREDAIDLLGLGFLIDLAKKSSIDKDFIEDIKHGWKDRGCKEALIDIEERLVSKKSSQDDKRKLLFDYYKKKREM